MKLRIMPIVVALLPLALPPGARGQAVLTGRLLGERWPGSAEQVPYSAVFCFASLAGPGSQALCHRTWETHPSGWYYLPGQEGHHTLVFSTPAHFMRPLVLTNLFTTAGDKVDRVLSPKLDHAVFAEQAWDDKPASHYFQTFVAKGKSVTQVGFKLATDGVDGGGPAGQNLLVSIHRQGNGTPDTWDQIGPTATVLNVDCGGPKHYIYSAGWNSGEVPLVPGKTCAVHLRAETPDGTFQAFWRPDDDTASDCYRVGAKGTTGFQGRDIWLGVSTDGDGLLIPYNKCVHKEYGEFAGGAEKWSQTYVAQGRSLASVILYAATSGTQPAIHRQRLAVRVRSGGPEGERVGTEKIAIGGGQFTGDASWGVFGLTYAPGEVPLTPGRTYAIEFETIENYETLHGYANIKGVPSNMIPGFNPYRKCPPDTCEKGTAYLNAKEAKGFDLDMQVIEYEHDAEHWDLAVDDVNLLANGDMEEGEMKPDQPAGGRPAAWKSFSADPATTHQYLADGKDGDNRILRVLGGGGLNKTADGGYTQCVSDLNAVETYRLTGRVRGSWPVDDKHQCMVGYDLTGQDKGPDAPTIVWTTLPALHGVFVPYESGPIRPKGSAISIWLRGRTTLADGYPFKADFDDFALRRVNTDVPQGNKK